MALRLRIPTNKSSIFAQTNPALRRPKTTIMASSRYSELPPPEQFDAEDCTSFSMAIMGDLHLPANAEEMTLFHQARDQLKEMTSEDGSTPRIIQLGDLGSYEKGWPGSLKCFSRSKNYLDSFNIPKALVLGNHDLEADEFETDPENLAAWHDAFKQRHYWSSRVGPITVIGMSTTRFRSNPYSVHEVHIDDEQIDFFRATVEQAASENRSVVVVTHAPPMGCGLKVVQAVHVKNRCAWLNHSSDPGVFLRIVNEYSNIKLWFSGHFHLSQSYPDSVSLVGPTAFILTGVIGDHSSRDGHRHSRLLKGNTDGFELYTVDHDTNTTRLDLRGKWNDPGPPEYLTPEDEFICDPSTGWLCSQVDCSIDLSNTTTNETSIAAADANTTTNTIDTTNRLLLEQQYQLKWFNAGEKSMLSLQDNLLIEYDVASMSAVGAVFLNLPDESVIKLVDAQGNDVDAVNTDGSDAIAVVAIDSESGDVVARVERNEQGGFYQIFQSNKWVARKEKEAAEAARKMQNEKEQEFTRVA